MINHEELKSKWLDRPDVDSPVEFTIAKDALKEMRLSGDNSKYPVYIFEVVDAKTGDKKEISVFLSIYRQMVRDVEKKKGLEPHTLASLVGSRWLWRVELKGNEQRVYIFELLEAPQ